MGGRRGRAAGRHGGWVAVAGARPNLVKLAPLCRAALAAGRRIRWIHTGQHARRPMHEALRRDLALPAPAVVLRAPRPGPERARRMARRLLEPLAGLRPSVVVVLGDVDSTVAGAEAARALGLPLVHVEAGLRTFERDLPEERNRVLVDHLSQRLYASEASGAANLRREGISGRQVRVPGNVMADALREAAPRIEARVPPGRRGLGEGAYALATLHRQANVDDPRRLAAHVNALRVLAREMPVAFPVHPRTARRLGPLRRRLRAQGVRTSPPLPYLDFLALLRGAAVAVTDSGGVQVEASLLGVPCFTLRARTEHRLTLTHGTNHLVGEDPRRLAAAVRTASPGPGRRRPRAWDGRAAGRIASDLARWLAEV